MSGALSVLRAKSWSMFVEWFAGLAVDTALAMLRPRLAPRIAEALARPEHNPQYKRVLEY